MPERNTHLWVDLWSEVISYQKEWGQVSYGDIYKFFTGANVKISSVEKDTPEVTLAATGLKFKVSHSNDGQYAIVRVSSRGAGWTCFAFSPGDSEGVIVLAGNASNEIASNRLRSVVIGKDHEDTTFIWGNSPNDPEGKDLQFRKYTKSHIEVSGEIREKTFIEYP